MNTAQHNIETMKKFQVMINTADEKMADALIDDNAPFLTPASPEPLYGGKGYLSLVHWLRKSFSNVQWTMQDIVAENDKVAVMWECSGTNDGQFMDIPATGKTFKTTFMNFYYFNENGKIIKDIAGVGMIGIIQALKN
ncbi:ester cyclase [Helicobacter sp.]|uniref:ester cyclase n=1 Tax=Helicobacter sp. TaxID=218 RepID=UPI0019CF0E42|nr:ester cyclase [Helicobacter sp.]MBD5164891.1 ester cyclase [Helicobacter sp.]